MFLRLKLRQSHAIVFTVFQTVFYGVWCDVPPFGSNIGQGKRFLANRLLILFLYKRYDFIYFSQGVQDVGAYKMILSQKTFVSVSQTPFSISTFVFRGSESSIILFRI